MISCSQTQLYRLTSLELQKIMQKKGWFNSTSVSAQTDHRPCIAKDWRGEASKANGKSNYTMYELAISDTVLWLDGTHLKYLLVCDFAVDPHSSGSHMLLQGLGSTARL